MTTQPEALRLADLLCKDGHECCDFQAAAELRRLHAENERLQERRDALRSKVWIMNAQNELDDAMRTPRAMAQAYEAGWRAALAQLQQVGWMQKSTGVIRCDWGFDTTGYVPVYAAQEQSE